MPPRPFVTYPNALDIDLYLWSSTLKRCEVGGVARVYELSQSSENEGVGSTHSPEFAMLGSYRSHTDYGGMTQLTRELYPHVVVFGSRIVRLVVDGSECDVGGEWVQELFRAPRGARPAQPHL